MFLRAIGATVASQRRTHRRCWRCAAPWCSRRPRWPQGLAGSEPTQEHVNHSPLP